MLVEHAEALPGASLAPLRLGLLSGDWIPLGLPERVRRRRGEIELISLGGATEASIWSIFFPVGEVEPAWASIPYGRPLANQRILVLDRDLEPRPEWVTGELYIAGLGLAQGYWRDPERTAAAFRTHPHTGERLYRTGDLGRFLPAGYVELLGREDLQVKVRGHRIELGEIEAALEQHPAVRSAVVVAPGHERNRQQLVAYVVPGGTDGDGLSVASSASPSAEELRRHLADRLPGYMIPGSFVFLDLLPLSANGKVDRRALPAVDAEPFPRRAFTAPEGPIEERLAAIWSAVLAVERVGTHDNFLELGGDSVTGVRMLARARAAGIEISIRELFERQTIAGLAGIARTSGNLGEERAEAGEWAASTELSREEIDDIMEEFGDGEASDGRD
jgi:acyl-coenzyme A synthetase/AMP-(fatty) acid ligase/aryl carrier-like protein